MHNLETIIEMDYSTQQLLQLIAESPAVINGNGLTVKEIAIELHISTDRVRAILAGLKKNDMLIVRNGYREYLDGKRGVVPVYSVRMPTV
jgi:Mn-dependent DtxR family transcriptional regulator